MNPPEPLAQAAAARVAPRRAVSEAALHAALLRDSCTPRDAKIHLRLLKIMGGHIYVAGEMLRLKRERKR